MTTNDDLGFLLSMMAKGWRIVTDCGPYVQFVQDRWIPHEEMPPVRSGDVGRPGYHFRDTFDETLQLCVAKAFDEFKLAKKEAAP